MWFTKLLNKYTPRVKMFESLPPPFGAVVGTIINYFALGYWLEGVYSVRSLLIIITHN